MVVFYCLLPPLAGGAPGRCFVLFCFSCLVHGCVPRVQRCTVYYRCSINVQGMLKRKDVTWEGHLGRSEAHQVFLPPGRLGSRPSPRPFCLFWLRQFTELCGSCISFSDLSVSALASSSSPSATVSVNGGRSAGCEEPRQVPGPQASLLPAIP